MDNKRPEGGMLLEEYQEFLKSQEVIEETKEEEKKVEVKPKPIIKDSKKPAPRRGVSKK